MKYLHILWGFALINKYLNICAFSTPPSVMVMLRMLWCLHPLLTCRWKQNKKSVQRRMLPITEEFKSQSISFLLQSLLLLKRNEDKITLVNACAVKITWISL